MPPARSRYRCGRGPPAPYTDPVTVTGTTHPERSATAWLDEGKVNGGWAPPAGNPVRPPRVSGSLVYGGVLLLLVLLLITVWSLGGFGRRTDLLRPVQPGALISTGPFEFTFGEATAQRQRDNTWKIVVIGQARTTQDESIAPKYFGEYGMFVLRDPVTRTTALPDQATVGDQVGAGDAGRIDLVPGLPLVPYRLTFPLPASYQPGRTIVFAVFDVVYEDTYLLTDEKQWHNGTYASRLDLPVRELPPQD